MLQGLCGLGWRVACTAASERHGKHKPSSTGWVCPQCQQTSFTPSKREPDVTLHSALAFFFSAEAAATEMCFFVTRIKLCCVLFWKAALQKVLDIMFWCSHESLKCAEESRCREKGEEWKMGREKSKAEWTRSTRNHTGVQSLEVWSHRGFPSCWPNLMCIYTNVVYLFSH